MIEWVANSAIPSIQTLDRQRPKELQMAVVAIIERFMQKFAAGDRMQKAMMLELANDLITDKQHWKMHDFVNFFDRAAKAEFGKIYHGVDYAKVYEFANAYENERSEQLARAHQEKIKRQNAPQPLTIADYKKFREVNYKPQPKQTEQYPDRKAYAQHKMNYELNKPEPVHCVSCGRWITKTEYDLFKGNCEGCK